MLVRRVLTALVGVPVVLACVWFGPPWITVLTAVAAVIGVGEAYRLYFRVGQGSGYDDGEETPLPFLLGGAWAIALVLAGELAERPQDFGWAALGICAIGVVVAGLWMIAAWHGKRPIAAASFLVISPVYIGGTLASAAALRG